MGAEITPLKNMLPITYNESSIKDFRCQASRTSNDVVIQRPFRRCVPLQDAVLPVYGLVSFDRRNKTTIYFSVISHIFRFFSLMPGKNAASPFFGARSVLICQAALRLAREDLFTR